MAVLGLLIQTKTGMPIYFLTWSEKIEKLKNIDTELVTGFFSALFSFTDSFHKTLAYLRLLDTPMEIFGVDVVCSEVDDYLLLAFVDSYQFHELVKYKLKWIHNLILRKYEQAVRNKVTIKLDPEEEVLIEDILRDHYQKSVIQNMKNQLNLSIDELISQADDNYRIYGISINSFDNSILYSYGVEYSTFELFLNNLGQKGSLIGDNEILYTYVSIPDFLPVLVAQVNPVIKFQIGDIIREMAEGELPIYFTIIINPDSKVRETVEKVIDKLKGLF
jgi:hypothetical protein